MTGAGDNGAAENVCSSDRAICCFLANVGTVCFCFDNVDGLWRLICARRLLTLVNFGFCVVVTCA